MSVEKLLGRLDAVQRNGKGWRARCPAHNSRGRSLSVAEGSRGGTLVHCFAGCSPVAVLDAVGMRLEDLHPQRIASHMRPVPKGERPFRSARQALDDVRENLTHAWILLSDIAANKPASRDQLRVCLTAVSDAIREARNDE